MNIKELLIKRQKLSKPITEEEIEKERQEIFKGKNYSKLDKKIKNILNKGGF